ncbi:hypothetical protein TcWFU_001310 [Taenia crassiceps]|uniref:Uncharacterized protein n=1 Tax=Taenia crassiceps TaxID=6207 RepID=A0ABR4QCS0_9CEST
MFSGTCFRNQNQFNEALRSFEVVQLKRPSSTLSTRSLLVLSMGLALDVGPGNNLLLVVLRSLQLQVQGVLCAFLNEPVVADLTKEFLQTFENRSFDSFQDLLGHMNSFMKATGSNYVMRNTFTDQSHLSVIISAHTRVMPLSAANKGCRSKIYFCCKGDRLQVGSYQIKHNHEVSPKNGSGELKIPLGKSRRKNPVKPDCKLSAKRVPPTRNEGDYDIVEAPENGNFGYPSRLDGKDNRWVEAPGPDLYPSLTEVCDASPRCANRIPAAILFPQLDFSLGNLKSLASSGGTARLFSCLQDLNALENKWKQEFEQDPPSEGMEVPFSVPDVFPNDGEEDSPPIKRPSIFSSSRRAVTRDFPPMDIPQPPELEQSEAEYANRPWFYD